MPECAGLGRDAARTNRAVGRGCSRDGCAVGLGRDGGAGRRRELFRGDFGGGEGVTDGDTKGVGNEVDIGEDVEFGFPVDREIDGGIGEFVVEAYSAHGPEVGIFVLPAEVAAKAPEPGKGGDATDELMPFIEAAETEARAPGYEAFEGIVLVHKIFYADAVADGRVGGVETQADCDFVVLCGQPVIAAADGQEGQAKGKGAHK